MQHRHTRLLLFNGPMMHVLAKVSKHPQPVYAPRPTKPARCARFRRDDLVDTVIGPIAAEAAASVLSDLKDDTARVAKYLQRYQEVQRHRMAMQVQLRQAGCAVLCI